MHKIFPGHFHQPNIMWLRHQKRAPCNRVPPQRLTFSTSPPTGTGIAGLLDDDEEFEVRSAEGQRPSYTATGRPSSTGQWGPVAGVSPMSVTSTLTVELLDLQMATIDADLICAEVTVGQGGWRKRLLLY